MSQPLQSPPVPVEPIDGGFQGQHGQQYVQADPINGGFQAQQQQLHQMYADGYPYPNPTHAPVDTYAAVPPNGAVPLPLPLPAAFPQALAYAKYSAIETAKPVNVVPTFQCKVCHIVCNCRDAFEKHKQGKKHQRNLQIQNRIIHNEIVGTSGATFTDELEKKKQTLLKNGAPVGSLLFCTVCNIACNDEAVFQTHLIGKKHATQVAKQASVAGPASVAPPNPISNATSSCQPPENVMEAVPVKIPQGVSCDLCGISCNSIEIFKTHLTGKRHLKNLEKSGKTICAVAATPTAGTAMENPEDTKLKGENLQEMEKKANPQDRKVKGENLQETEKKANPKDVTVESENLLETENKAEVAVTLEEDVKNKDPQNTASNRCSVCNITCTSPQLLNAHLLGKKHKKNLLKAEAETFIGPLIGPATQQIIGPARNQDGVKGSAAEIRTPQSGAKRSRGSNEDVETKRQKMIVGGGAAPDLVRVCNICNVVCSSPTVYISHLAGRKHLAEAKKATVAGTPPVTA